MSKPVYFQQGEAVKVIKPFWFYSEYYEEGTVFTIEAQHELYDFKEYVIKA